MATRRMNLKENAWRKGLRAMACCLLKIAAMVILPLGLLRAADDPGAAALNLTPQEQAWLRQHPQIRVGLDPAWPPFSFFDHNHDMAGMDIDMLHLLQERLGISFVITSGEDWAQVYAEIKSGGVDMLGGVALTPERTKDLNFTESYIGFPVGIITRDDGPFMIGFPQLEGHLVAAPRDYAPTLMLQRSYPSVQLILTENVADALRMVSQKRAFATIDNLASANYIIKDNGLSNLKVAGITNDEFELRYGVRKDWPELPGILHKALVSISDQQREAIRNKWINLDVDNMLSSRRYEGVLQASRSHEALLLDCFGVVVVATLIVLAWNWSLAREVSRRKKAELELKEVSSKAVDANRMKSVFLANLSHEIRNPLNALLGFTELLKEEASDVKFKKYVEGIDAGGRTLLGIINDVLDLSKVEAGRIEIRPVPVDLRVIFDETHALFAPRAGQKGIGFSLKVDSKLPPLLLLDELRLRQIIYNAASNAVKFTSEGFVCLKVSCASDEEAPEHKTVIIEVIDSGPGIPLEDHQRIFEPFAQRLGQNPRLGGTGLGLAISKRLTELMGGRLELESVPGRGSTFRFIFPHVREAAPECPQPVVRKGDLSDFKSLTVLVVDDLESNRELLKEYFQCAGHVVLEAADAEEGILCAKANHPDLVLLDFRMPGMNGRDAALVLKTDPSTAAIPVIFISGSIHLESETPGVPEAILLPKPLVYADLVAALRRLLPDAIKPDSL